MCGIFGVINTKEMIDKGRVLAARDILNHRGPDDEGIYISKDTNVALAHRRLSIIDLSPAAHQPMTTPDGRYTIVYNGEIYNYKELSKQLIVNSKQSNESNSLLITDHSSPITHHPSLLTNSDTEVILNLYIKHGKECLHMLRGMFAFAIWDNKEKTLFAARDRFGIKPFYYLKNDDEFIFSSELKAIKHYKNNLTISNEGIDAFLRTGSVPAPLTIYEEVSALLPGNYLVISEQKLEISEYWNFNNLFSENSSLVTDHGGSATSRFYRDSSRKKKYDNDAKQKIRTALLDSVRSHLVSDVEVGAFLSGGIDSTAIVSLMRQVGQEKIKTVSVVFPNNKLDESKYSRLAAKYYKTEHIEIPFYEKDLIEDFEKIMASMDQPTIDGINTYFVSKAAKQAGLKVVLSGLGGDELFGGYPSFINIPKYQRIKNIPFTKLFMKAAAPLLKNKLPAKAIEYFLHPDAENAEYKMVRGLFTDSELQKLGWSSSVISSETRNLKDFSVDDSFEMTRNQNPASVISTTEGRRNLADKISQSPDKSGSFEMTSIQYPESNIQHLTSLQYISMMETTHYMRNQLLRDSDVFSMAHSLELRVPFVDHLLYKTVLPYIDSAFDKNYPKKMLVDAVGDIPLELINRPKMGFTFPFAEWINNGQLKDLIIERLKDSEFVRRGGLNINPQTSTIGKLHWSRLWALFVISNFTK